VPLIDEHVENMLKHDVIDPATSLQDGTMRFCVDYRKTNELIKRISFLSLKSTAA